MPCASRLNCSSRRFSSVADASTVTICDSASPDIASFIWRRRLVNTLFALVKNHCVHAAEERARSRHPDAVGEEPAACICPWLQLWEQKYDVDIAQL